MTSRGKQHFAKTVGVRLEKQSESILCKKPGIVQVEKIEQLVFAFQPQENPEALTPNAKKLAEYLGTKIGIKSNVFMPTSYAAVVEALRSKNADVAYFSGWPYLIAHNTADVELLISKSFHTFQLQKALPAMQAQQRALAARLAAPEMAIADEALLTELLQVPLHRAAPPQESRAP